MTIQRHEVDALLGPAVDDLTDCEKDDLARTIDAISDRYPDDEESQQAAVNAALMLALGDATLEDAADEWKRARAVERDKMAALTGALRAASDQGATELGLCTRLDLNRGTVRKALGK